VSRLLHVPFGAGNKNSSPIRRQNRLFSCVLRYVVRGNAKQAKVLKVVDLKIDTEEVDGSSPFGPTISSPRFIPTCVAVLPYTSHDSGDSVRLVFARVSHPGEDWP
jgi:hypothetical protein